MKNKISLYEQVFDNDFSNREVSNYINTLIHNDKCLREIKDRYNPGDERVGKIEMLSEVYRVYSCQECGALYSVKDMKVERM